MTTHPPFLSMGFWSLEWISVFVFFSRAGNCQDRASCWYPCRHFIFSNTTRCWTRPSKNNSRANYILSKYTATLKALRLLSRSFTTTHSPSWSLRSAKPAPLTQHDLHLQAPSWNSFPMWTVQRRKLFLCQLTNTINNRQNTPKKGIRKVIYSKDKWQINC